MEIAWIQPLCWILDNEWIIHYKECMLDDLQNARKYKVDILTTNNEVLTDYQVAKYWEADTIHRFLYFSLPGQPKYIRNKFKIAIANMSREQKKALSYDAIKITIDRWKHDEEYYK